MDNSIFAMVLALLAISVIATIVLIIRMAHLKLDYKAECELNKRLHQDLQSIRKDPSEELTDFLQDIASHGYGITHTRIDPSSVFRKGKS